MPQLSERSIEKYSAAERVAVIRSLEAEIVRKDKALKLAHLEIDRLRLVLADLTTKIGKVMQGMES